MKKYKLYKNKNVLTSTIQIAQGMQNKCNYKLFLSSVVSNIGISFIKVYNDCYLNVPADIFYCLTGSTVLICFGQLIIDKLRAILLIKKSIN